MFMLILNFLDLVRIWFQDMLGVILGFFIENEQPRAVIRNGDQTLVAAVPVDRVGVLVAEDLVVLDTLGDVLDHDEVLVVGSHLAAAGLVSSDQLLNHGVIHIMVLAIRIDVFDRASNPLGSFSDENLFFLLGHAVMAPMAIVAR